MAEQTRSLGQGYIQVYTGKGKGKTTAALGLAFRAMGRGLKTYVGQFMKGQQYGELEAAKRCASCITLEQYGEPSFIHKRGPSEEDLVRTQTGIEKAREAMLSGDYSIIVLDEILTAHSFGLLSLQEIKNLLEEKPQEVELVLTGRDAPSEVIALADLVTEMVEVKHYYKQGVAARVGIER